MDEVRMPKKLLKQLKEARVAATLKNASFAFPKDCLHASQHMSEDFHGHPDDYIKEKTRLHRETWVLPAIDAVIAWAEGRKPNA
jgi:hypothetical protein